ncbi:hypothetical protein [Umezawaea beigongshangensis]|uniref:hypothetical protein n=1 Tax=Umezawaea beigongshangensis TaxID=2780383 RepID=UPI0018F26CE8|nr:hypothetical protein [Umezawaea beigongshangensis]
MQTIAANTDVELLRRMRRLVTLIRAQNCLTSSVSTWLGIQDNHRSGVTHRLLSEDRRCATSAEAHVLDLDEGERTTYRQGELWAELAGVPVRLASVNALVVTSRLPRSVREDLDLGIPLGLALQKVGMRRQTDAPDYRYVTDERGGTGLVAELTASLLVNGVPWVLTDERLEQSIVAHREPGPGVLAAFGWTSARAG